MQVAEAFRKAEEHLFAIYSSFTNHLDLPIIYLLFLHLSFSTPSPFTYYSPFIHEKFTTLFYYEIVG
jgi:hypothetical protein